MVHPDASGWIGVIVPLLLTGFFLWHAASALALYWAGSSLVAVGESAIRFQLNRRTRIAISARS